MLKIHSIAVTDVIDTLDRSRLCYRYTQSQSHML